MSTTVLDSTKPAVPEPAPSAPAALFRYSTWLHVGVGAEECAEVDENEGHNGCGDRAHFHAWCRLPNPLQQAELRDRALAAKARKVRQLRDPSSDAYEVLEEEFQMRERAGDRDRESVIDELINLDFWRDYYDAMMEVRQIEDPGGEEDAKLYAHIEDDQARFMRLEALPEDRRPSDEFEELRKHLDNYQKATTEALNGRQQPKREALEQLSTSELLEQLRDQRIDHDASREFQRVFEIHSWLSCAYRQPDGDPVFTNIEQLEAAAPEVIAGLQSVFGDLNRTAQEARGN